MQNNPGKTWGSFPQRRVLFSLGAKRRKFGLWPPLRWFTGRVGTRAGPVHTGASNPLMPRATLTARAPYNNNINYNTNNTTINLTLQPPVSVTSPGGDPGNAEQFASD
jgi:hypothetical protein